MNENKSNSNGNDKEEDLINDEDEVVENIDNEILVELEEEGIDELEVDSVESDNKKNKKVKKSIGDIREISLQYNLKGDKNSFVFSRGNFLDKIKVKVFL